MRMFYAQHNPPIATNAPFVRVIHLRKSKGSFFLNDLDDGVQNIRTQYKIPAYIPFGKTIDILLVDRALTSYQQGAIRSLMNKGEIAAFILVNRDVIQADIGEIYEVNLIQSLVTIDTSGGAAFVTLPTENIPEGWEIEVKKTTPDLNQIQLNAGTGDIEGQGPLYVVTGEQKAVKLTYNNGTWWVTKASSPPSPTQATNRWIVTSSIAVPSSGVLYLSSGNVPTSSCPFVTPSNGFIRELSVRVDRVDTARSFNLEVVLNGSVITFLNLPVGSLRQYSTMLSIPFLGGDEIAIRLVSLGSGKSSFRNVNAMLAVAL